MNGGPPGAVRLDRTSDEVTASVRTADSAAREAAASVPDVHFLGFLNQSQLPRLYPAADLFVLPSHSETFGLVLIEAMLAGLPVIASDGVGCAEDLVTPDTGLTFPRADTAALTAALSTLCGDAALRERLSAGARARVAPWTYERATDGLLAALDTVRSGPRQHT